MEIDKLTENAVSMWKSYKRGDPVMLRKTVRVRDSLYKKSRPDKELWHTEMTFDCSFYAAVAMAILVLAGAVALLCGLWHGLCRPFSMMRRRR